MRAIIALLRETASRWVDDRCDRLGASLAYYAIFSLFPLLLLSVTVLGYALGDGTSTRLHIVELLAGAAGSPFGLVAAAGLVLLASLIFSTAQSAMGHWGWGPPELVASVFFLIVALAAMFRALPRTRVAWGDVLGGALLTAVLLAVLKRLLRWYLAHLGSYAAYGAVGAVLGLLLLIYSSSLTVFFGAELTRAYAERYGSLSRAAYKQTWARFGR